LIGLTMVAPPLRIVLIEDHDLTRAGMRLMLRHSGVEVVAEATTGQEGLNLIAQHQPDLAMVDIGLPDLDGVTVTRAIKAQFPQIKVLILSLQDMEETVAAAFAAGADSYCMKDISPDNLLLALRLTNQGISWLDPAIAPKVLKQLKIHRVAVPPSMLTKRELEVLELIVAGQSNQSISERLYVSVGTVKTHVRNILNKLGVEDRAQAAVLALRSGLVL